MRLDSIALDISLDIEAEHSLKFDYLVSSIENDMPSAQINVSAVPQQIERPKPDLRLLSQIIIQNDDAFDLKS